MVFLNDIQRAITGEILLSEPLGRYTSFGVGGPADYYVVPASGMDFVRAVAALREGALPFVLLGQHSNVLVSDQGYRGAVVMLEPGLSHMSFERDADARSGGSVRAEAGVQLAAFLEYCEERSLKGAEVLAGRRGTVGGWVARNFGQREDAPANSIVDVEILRDGKSARLKQSAGEGAPRLIDSRHDIVLAATFRLPVTEKGELMRMRRQWLIRHNADEPLNLANAGAIFKDPPGRSAAELIEKAGLKGKHHGRAQISEANANFIVAEVGSTASDILSLIKVVQQRVSKELHVQLELKVKLLGFERQALQKVA